MRTVDLATTRQLPTMASCLRCQANGTQERHCTDCHLAQAGGLMQVQFEHGTLVPAQDGLGDTHGPRFKNDHKTEASQVGATCNACHDRSECVECHLGSVKPMDFHPGDYLMTHAIDARRGQPDCSACHRLESFCVACHERSGLGTRAASQFSSQDPARYFHPAGWASPTTGGPNLHAGEARRNINTCVSCHREEDCLTCHSAQPGAAHASPHPPSWKGSAQCRALDRGNRRMCLRCHVAQNEARLRLVVTVLPGCRETADATAHARRRSGYQDPRLLARSARRCPRRSAARPRRSCRRPTGGSSRRIVA